MFCYNCGCHLSEHDFCTACGVDVSLYKRIIRVSNTFYNMGLEKAQVRDLSGAVNSLRQSLKFNKNNIEARNLLGLVYFEMGEVVAALSEWVISKNLRPDKNIADNYIEMVQSNAARLDSINQTIKKYNQAYAYCIQDSKDLAIIQLKKVLSLNPKFIRAHQLLALLYMDSEQWERARRELTRCIRIDRNNTLSLRYLQEVEMMLAPEEADRQSGKRKGKNEDVIRYQNDNEVIIQPLNVRETKSSGIGTIINIGIGLVIGAAAMYFLAVPAARTEARNKAQEEVVSLGNQLDSKTSQIKDLETQIANLQGQNANLADELNGYEGAGGTLQTIDSLLTAAATYLETEDLQQTAVNLEAIAQSVNVEETSEAFRRLYQTILASIGPQLSETYREEGYTAFRNEDYPQAIESLSRAVYYDAANGEALFDLGNAYRRNQNTQEALATYDKVLELFPDTEWARKATQYKNQMIENGE
ncbi:MAG: tetratricopeptide repeat protein [Roseburia sp.]|nr:tetratricopeptide repeat protein [Roseburia sp.]